MEKKLTPLQI